MVAVSGNYAVYDIQMASLAPNEWVDSAVVDTYLNLVVSNSRPTETCSINFAFLPRPFFMFENGIERSLHSLFPRDVIEDPMNTLVLLPSLHLDHFWLTVINPERYDIYVYDSMSNYLSQRQRAEFMRGLISNLEIIFPGTQGLWTCDLEKSVQQKDGFNCGVFVMFYAKELTLGHKDSIGDTTFRPNEFREEVALELLNTTTAGRELLRLNNYDWVRTFQHLEDMTITRH